jgi:pimeloyl-ACP methyl ester carboxylesterase
MPFPRSPRGGLLLAIAALPVLCLAGMALGVGALSYRWLTNPPGYHHPGAAGRRVVEAASLFERDPQTEHGLSFQEVDFPTAGGATLRGWLVPAPEPPAGKPRLGLVFAHARGGDRRNYLEQVPLFRDLGATTLLFDFREHGLSDGAGRGMGLGTREAADVSAAVRYLKETVGVQRVVVVGHSLGGSAVLLAGAQDPNIDGVIADSAIASFDDYVYDLGEQLVQRLPLEIRPESVHSL